MGKRDKKWKKQLQGKTKGREDQWVGKRDIWVKTEDS